MSQDQEYDFAVIYVDKHGEYTAVFGRYDRPFPRPMLMVEVGLIEAHLPMEAEEFAEWLVKRCPNFRYPDVMSEPETEELRVKIRRGEYIE